jgi:hypothetical protein
MNIIFNILISLTLLGCKGQTNEKCISDLKEKLQIKKNNRESEKIINIRDSVKCIEWDEILVVMAIASSRENIQKIANITIPYNYSDSPYNFYGDNDTFIFFIKNKVAVNHVLLTNSREKKTYIKYDFLFLLRDAESHAFVSRKDAVFEVYTRDMHDNQANKWKRENVIRIKK